VAITSGCLSVYLSSNSSSLACVSWMRLKVSDPPPPPRPPLAGELPAADITESLRNCFASSSRRLMATDKSDSAFLAASTSFCSWAK
jgi:hypothetical protein